MTTDRIEKEIVLRAPLARVWRALTDAEQFGTATRLTIVESGFDALPAGRRELAFRSNDHGWTIQAENIRVHVEG